MNKLSEAAAAKLRVQFEFNPDTLKKLDQLVQDTHASSRAEVVRRALSLYSFLVEATNRKATLCVEEADGTIKRMLPW